MVELRWQRAITSMLKHEAKKAKFERKKILQIAMVDKRAYKNIKCGSDITMGILGKEGSFYELEDLRVRYTYG